MHDIAEYHGRCVCRTCLEEWCCGYAAAYFEAGACKNDAPILNPTEMEELSHLRIAFTDGEMSNLQADFGQLLCACIVEYRSPTKSNPNPWANMRTFTLKDYKGRRWDDRSLAREWRDALQSYDIIVTWNGIKFDVPFLNTRLQQWGDKELTGIRHKDLMYTARFKLRLASSSLENVSTYLGVHDKYGIAKTKMEPRQWVMAMGGYEPAYKYIIRHCQLDVKVLAAVWQETKSLVTEIK